MFGVFSDAHEGIGGRGDVSNRDGLLLVLAYLLSIPELRTILVLGDWLDFWRFGLRRVLDYNRGLFRLIADQVLGSGRSFVWVKGNHDSFSLDDWPQIEDTLARCGLELGKGFDVRGGDYTIEDDGQLWHCLHGHQFDRANADDSWFRPVAFGVTRFSGQVGRLVPGWDDNRINPVAWVSAAKRGEEVLQTIKSGACKWADAHNAHLLFGHTHRLADAQSTLAGYHVVNVGCVSKGRAACVVVNGGEATPVPLQGFV